MMVDVLRAVSPVIDPAVIDKVPVCVPPNVPVNDDPVPVIAVRPE